MNLYNIMFYSFALIIVISFAIGITYAVVTFIRDDRRGEKQKKLQEK